MHAAKQRLAFFRQSGWMVISTGVGGMFMWLVHVPAQARMPTSEYGVFVALLQLMNLMLIPAIGLQTVFAQQAAAAIDAPRQRQLAAAVRSVLVAVVIIWLAMVGAAVLWRHDLIESLKIENPAALWISVGIGLMMLFWPVLQGLLQGQQNFLWLGWVQILNGVGRFVGVVTLVWWLGNYAAGAMVAALAGFLIAGCAAGWQTRHIWLGQGERLDWGRWLGRVVPLTLGLGAGQFMMAADQLVVQSVFPQAVTGWYGAVGMIGRALFFFTAALLAVMFPKIVASAARSERTDVLAQALGATLLLGGGAATVCTIAPQLPLHLIYRPAYWGVAPLVPWFVWSMLPLTLANILIGNLLARERFRVVPWLVLVAIGYGVALWWRAHAADQAPPMQMFNAVTRAGSLQPLYFGVASALRLPALLSAFEEVVRTLGVFNLLLLAVAIWFTWRPSRRPHRLNGSSASTP